jgi:transposase InsO family protein
MNRRAGTCEQPIHHTRRRSRPVKIYWRLLKSHGLQQEFIHPHTPKQNGVVAAYHKTFKRECVWQHRFATLEEVLKTIGPWIENCNNRRPHSSLSYLSPAAWRGTDVVSWSDLLDLEEGRTVPHRELAHA